MKTPDTRGMIVAGLFALVFYIITLLAFVPTLKDNQLFQTIATLIVGTAFVGGAVAFYFSSNKSSADKDITISKQLDQKDK